MAQDDNLPAASGQPELAPFEGNGASADWHSPAPHPGSGGFPWHRYLAAARRYRWLLVASVLLGAGAGAGAYKLVEPEFVATGSLWINSQDQGAAGPISQAQLLQSQAWVDLLRSFTVLEPAAVEQRLFIMHAAEDEALFREFDLAERFQPGRYRISVSADGLRYTLQTGQGVTVETGRTGDAVGRDVGFLWNPPRAELRSTRSAEFTVVSPRDAAQRLSEMLTAGMDERGNFIRLELRGKDPQRITRALRSVMERNVEVAARLKASQLVTYREILGEQLDTVDAGLREAELDLERFRVQTITLPSDQSAPIASGLAQTQAPVLQDFFTMRLELDALTRDRIRLQEAVDQIPDVGVRVAAFELIPRVQTSSALTVAFSELTLAQAELRALTQRYTDEYEPVRAVLQRIERLERETIPTAARVVIAELEAQERALQRTIESRAAELEEIPPRAIEEARLERRVSIATTLYIELRQRHETATLAAASSVPDVSILDLPAVRDVPSNDQRLRYTAIAFLAFLGLGVAGVVLLDRFDPRLRHPSDVLDQIGLDIIGAVPRVMVGRRGVQKNIEQAREAFRELRMRVQYAYGSANRPMLLAVTSPAKGEGKTFVAANLAIAFSELGMRTLLIDGDTRQGDLHELFGRERKPGLTDVLAGTTEGTISQRTEHRSLSFVGSGSRSVASPDLLNTQRMQNLLALAKRHYDLILIDCPPLGAGSDAFILGAHTGNVLVVLRTGSTNKGFALAKLEPFYHLPVRILGAVLNDVDASSAYGPYRYYSAYLAGYEAVGENGEKPGAVALPEP